MNAIRSGLFCIKSFLCDQSNLAQTMRDNLSMTPIRIFVEHLKKAEDPFDW